MVSPSRELQEAFHCRLHEMMSWGWLWSHWTCAGRRSGFLRGVVDGTPIRLTKHPRGREAPAWSPDGRSLASSPREIAASTSMSSTPTAPAFRRVTSDGAARGDLAWEGDGDLVVPPFRGAVWQVERIDPRGRILVVPNTTGVQIIKSAGVGGLYAVKGDDHRLWRLGQDGAVPVSPLIRVSHDAVWAPTRDGAYQLAGVPGGEIALRLTTWDGAARDVQSLGTVDLRHSLAVSPTQDVVAARVVRDERDLRAIRLARREAQPAVFMQTIADAYKRPRGRPSRRQVLLLRSAGLDRGDGPSIDDEVAAVDCRGAVRGQEGDEFGDLFRFGGAAEGDAAETRQDALTRVFDRAA